MAPTDTSTIEASERTSLDAEAVERALDGDRDAMAQIYDRYADRIHTMCVHMLGDPDEAADVCAQVFLVALQRLHQLREPAKLRSWLYAITRHEVYRRTRDRSRERPVEELDDVVALAADPTGLEAPAADATSEIPGADPEQLAALVQAAAAGLEDRDRMVLELNVAQGLEGQELADALGVGLDNAYQVTHRMRERLERSAGALLVVSAGRSHCSDLDRVAGRWDGDYDVLWRKRFARHVDRCDRCQRMRARLPRALLAGTALSQAAQSAVLAAPISVREQVLAHGPSAIGSETARAWSSDGFPRGRRSARRLVQFAAACVFALIAVAGLGAAVGDGTLETDRDSLRTPAPRSAPSESVVPPGANQSGGVPDLGEPLDVPGATTPEGPTGGAVPQPPDGDASVPPGDPSVPPGDGSDPAAPSGPVDATAPDDPITEGTPETEQTPGGAQTDPGPGVTGPGGTGNDTPLYDPENPPVIDIPPPTLWVPPAIVTTTSIPALF